MREHNESDPGGPPGPKSTSGTKVDLDIMKMQRKITLFGFMGRKGLHIGVDSNEDVLVF